MNRSTPGLPVHHQLPEFTETHSQTLKRAVCPFLSFFFFLCTFRLFSGPLLFFFPGIMGQMCVCVCVCVCARTHTQSLSHVCLFGTPWTVAHQAPLSVKFSRQEYWSGLPFLPPADLPNTGIEPVPLASPTLVGRFFTTKPLGKQWVQLMG